MSGVLILEDGGIFPGQLRMPPGSGLAQEGAWFGEVVFNTSMTGYQEMLTDPSYAGQFLVLTHPQTGNYGMTGDHAESARPWVTGLITLESWDAPSHWTSEVSLPAFLAQHGLPVLEGCDTRGLTRHLRVAGTLRGALVPLPPGGLTLSQRHDLLDRLSTWRMPSDLVDRVTGGGTVRGRTGSPHIVVVDLGAKRGIVRCLEERRAQVSIVPAGTSPQEVERLHPDGIVLSNGPGDPEDCRPLLPAVRSLATRHPVLGICLGHQLLALAFGAQTGRLPFGHRGANHTVQDLQTGRLLVTSHNHGYTVLEESLPPHLEVTYRDLHDGSVEGLRHRSWPSWGVQFHPEASPGPLDATYVFDQFLENVRRQRRWVLAC